MSLPLQILATGLIVGFLTHLTVETLLAVAGPCGAC